MATSTPKDQGVTFSVDDLERDQSELREPFTAMVGGRRITFTDPQEIDWLDLQEIDENPSQFVGACIEDSADRTHFYETRIPSWKINKLIDAFLTHYGITRRGNRFASRR